MCNESIPPWLIGLTEHHGQHVTMNDMRLNVRAYILANILMYVDTQIAKALFIMHIQL